MSDQAIGHYQPTDYDKRNSAIHFAVNAGAKPAEVVKIATDIYAFLTSGNDSASTSKPATETAKTAKASAQSTDTPAQEQSSAKPVAEAKKSTTTEAASGFAEDGTEIDVATVRAAAVKFVSANDEPALKAKLAEHGADKLSALEPSNYAAFIASLEVPVADAGVFD